MLSVATAYLARSYNNIMDVLQLAFGFVNAPLFATFLLGMFWKRATAHGAFAGLLAGTCAAALVHGGTVAEGKGGWLTDVYTFPTVMAQNFWIAIFAWVTCFLVTIAVSSVTRPKPVTELEGLAYGASGTVEQASAPWYRRPVLMAGIVAILWLALNLIFW